MDPTLTDLLTDKPALMASLIPALEKWEGEGILSLVRDETGTPIAVHEIDIDRLRAEVERLREEIK